MGVNPPYIFRLILLLIGLLMAGLLAFIDIVFAAEPKPTQPPDIILVTASPAELHPIQAIDAVKLESIRSDADQLRAEIDKLVDSLWPTLETQQEKYRAMTGRFFQGLPSHMGQLPKDGGGEFPAGWYTHPTDQQYRWSDIRVIQFSPMSFDLRIDVYDGPEGVGWVACYQVEIDKDPWEKCRNQGPEALRNSEWAQVIAEDSTP